MPISVLAQHLRQRRQALGINQRTLAVRMGMVQSQISKYESGETLPSSETLTVMAQALQVSTDWLVGLSEAIQPDLTEQHLSPAEQAAVDAWRRGDRLDAIKTIILDADRPYLSTTSLQGDDR